MSFKLLSRRNLLTAVAVGAMAVGVAGAASSQNAKPLRIGVIDDLSGPNSVASGPGTIEATKMAVEDYGGKGAKASRSTSSSNSSTRALR